MSLCHGEAVEDEELDLLRAQRAARLLGQLLPHLERRQARLQHERAAVDQPAQRVGVPEDLVVGRDHDLDVLELGVGELDRLGTQRDVVVGRRAALLGPVLGRRLRVHAEHAGQDVRDQLAGGDRAVAADRVEPHAERFRRQQHRVGLGLERHQFRLGIGRLQACLQRRELRRRVLREELAAEVDERCVVRLHVPERCDHVPRLQVVRAQAEDRRGHLRQAVQRRDAVVADAVRVLDALEQRLGHECQSAPWSRNARGP